MRDAAIASEQTIRGDDRRSVQASAAPRPRQSGLPTPASAIETSDRLATLSLDVAPVQRSTGAWPGFR
jgi:hypothetical protein